MNTRLVLIVAFVAIAGAQGVRELAKHERAHDGLEEPFAPSADSARIVSLGYREVWADLLFFRLVGYFGGGDATAPGVARLVEAIAALDPQFSKIYEWGARAIVATRRGVDNEVAMRAIRILETGLTIFPDDYKIPRLAGEIYLYELKTKDGDQRRRWDEQAARLIESSVRKPDAPADGATFAAHLRSKLGQRQRAVDGLREMLLITSDDRARGELLEKLGELEQADTAEIAAELFGERKRFQEAWKRDRPSISPSLYILLGPVSPPGFDLADLATGGRDLVGTEPFERLEPLTDPTVP